MAMLHNPRGWRRLPYFALLNTDQLFTTIQQVNYIQAKIQSLILFMKPIFTLFMGLCFIKSYSQGPVDVTEQTIKVPGLEEQVMYYAFAEGDKIVFNFSEEKGKELKEVEILEYPATSKFMDFKASKVENKTLNVLRTGIYKFRFYNGNVAGRICNVKIQRIPASEQTKFFNTSVTWVEKQDTTWNTYTKDVIVTYDTTYQQKTKKELVKTEQIEETILDKIERVHSQTNAKGNKTHLFFTLPSPQSSDLVTKKVVSWGYWVGVGEEANAAWKQNKIAAGAVKSIATYFTTPLGGYLAGALTQLILPSSGNDVLYGLVDNDNKDLFYRGLEYKGYDFGKGIAGYKKFTHANILQGTWYIILSNDNVMQGIDVTVKVVALIEINTYEYKTYQEQKITPRYQKKIFKDPVISKKTIPVITN